MAYMSSAAVQAADLNAVDRKIAKEPAYQTKTPRYCLLVFGPEAKTRVWLVQDGDTLYVDRNGNGDLTEEGKKVACKDKGEGFVSFPAGEVKADGLTHTDLFVTLMKATEDLVGNMGEWKRIEKESSDGWIWTVRLKAERDANDKRLLPKKIGYLVNGDGLGMLVFGDKPQTAPIIHLNGPWTLGLQDMKQQFVAGHKSQLQIGVGTQGIGQGTFAFVLYPNTIPADAYPEAEITFPARSADKKALASKLTMKQRC